MIEQDANYTNLLLRAIAGDASAYGDLYLYHVNTIFRYIYFRVAEKSEAEDLTELVFLKAWEKLPEYRYCDRPFLHWLYRIAHNVVIDNHRKAKSIIGLDSVERNIKNNPTDTMLELMIEQSQIDRLAMAISQLNPDQQQVIILRFMEDLSHREISNILQRSESACRMLQLRALRALNHWFRINDASREEK